MGGHGHGHGHGPPQIGYYGKPLNLPPGVKMPDWKQYKLEDTPELFKIKKRLAAKGLNDPWLRNEIWRYDWRIWGTPTGRTMKVMFRGFHYAVGLAVLSIGINDFLLADPNFDPHEDKYPLLKEVGRQSHGHHGHH